MDNPEEFIGTRDLVVLGVTDSFAPTEPVPSDITQDENRN